MVKPAKNAFDAQTFLAKVGEGKSILRFKNGQNVFVQGDPAERVYYIQKGKIKVTVLSDQHKEAVAGVFGSRAVFWRRLHEWPYVAHLHDDGNGRLRHDGNNKGCDDCHAS
jgi:hypothetical protein